MADRLRFIGVGRADASAELAPPRGAVVDPAELRALARAHEDAGFDAVLVSGSDTGPHALVVAGEILRQTTQLGLVVTVAPHLMAATAAARALATLDALHPGRVAAALSAGRPGDAEYADLLRLTWSSPRPFDYDGRWHHATRAWSAVRPADPLPLWTDADESGVDADHRFVRLRPIVAPTARAANDYAERVLRVYRGAAETPAAALRDVTGARAGGAPLVGSPEQVAAALTEHVPAGVSAVQLAGWTPLVDVPLYGRLIAAAPARPSALTTRRPA